MEEKPKDNLINKIAAFVVDKRIIVMAVFFALAIFCAVMIPKTNVEYDLTAFLPKGSETKQALDVMEGKFTDIRSFDLMVKDLSLSDAKELQSSLSSIEGVSLANFSENESSFKDGSAMYSITLNDDADSSAVAKAIKELVSGKEYYSVSLAENTGLPFATEMLIILLVAAVVIILALFLTSKSFLEIPVFLIIFLVAGVLNMGTNFLLPRVSFITNSIAIVLQLALAVDYSIIFVHRYVEERKNHSEREAIINAFSKAVKEIISSSLTTIAGLVALMLMTLQIGLDLGIVLAKGIVISCLCVFVLMPGLIRVFAKPIDKTLHRSFIPSVKRPAKAMLKARYAIVSLFLCIVVASGVAQGFNTYSYEYRTFSQQHNIEKIESVFGKKESVGVLLDDVNYDVQYEIIKALQGEEGVLSVTGLANVEIGGVRVTQKVTPKQLVSILPSENQTEFLVVARAVYMSYAILNKEFAIGMDIDEYAVPMIDIVDHAYVLSTETGGIDLPPEITQYYDLYKSARHILDDGRYGRILISVDVSENKDKDFSLLDRIDSLVKEYSDSALMFGNYAVTKELSRSFTRDVVMITILTCAFIFIILLITFRSIILPFILIFVIQGSIFINFSIPVMFSDAVFFLSYIIVSAIQMGATIDYAIVITNRYLYERQKTQDKKEAMSIALDKSFRSVITSGLMLVTAGFLVGTISSNTIISSIGMFLGAGALISLIVALFVLPQLLVVLDGLILKTTLKRRRKSEEKIDAQEDISVGLQSDSVE